MHGVIMNTGNGHGPANRRANFNTGLDESKGDGRQRQPQYDAGIETHAVELEVGAGASTSNLVAIPTPDRPAEP